MPLSDADGRRVMEWVAVRCRDLRCPACQGTSLNAAEVVTVPLAMPPQDGANPPPGVPMVAVVCTFCAYLQFFSASIMGLATRVEVGASAGASQSG
jgi:hypothetical protein